MRYLILLMIFFVGCSEPDPKFSVGDCSTDINNVFQRKIIGIEENVYVYILTASTNPRFRLKSRMNIKDFDNLMKRVTCHKKEI